MENQYMKSVRSMIYVGTRLKMKFCMEESPERSFSGVVTGVGDLDPYKWSNSKWRCLMVRWDEDIGIDHQEWIFSWDIDLSARIMAKQSGQDGIFTNPDNDQEERLRTQFNGIRIPDDDGTFDDRECVQVLANKALILARHLT
ncbi:Aux/IAA-ARF-dimerization [Artemisia annua]|uniref:Aux/IAA-ARF-dimerization n=1 Tax=Artemisia annua TaxID=35608 RepID=A0A2U1PG69_ARTAN|nr:Aux/IAA-ARF-dimerization [Artemisia annua]